MPNPWGRASRFAFRPNLVLEFIDSLERKGRRGPSYRDENEGRTLRRWRKVDGVTRRSATRIFLCYNSNEEEFLSFCDALGYDPVLRGTLITSKEVSA